MKLPNQVQAWIQEGKLAGGAARALCSEKIADPEALAKRVIEEGLNVRQIEAIARGEDPFAQTRDEGETKEAEPENGAVVPEVPSPDARSLYLLDERGRIDRTN